MGRGVFVDAAVEQMVATLTAANEPEAGVLRALLIDGAVVPEITNVEGRAVSVALLAQASGTPWTVLLVGRYQLSCELLVEAQRQQLLAAGRPFDTRGCVPSPHVWRVETSAETTWELWNTRVREIAASGPRR